MKQTGPDTSDSAVAPFSRLRETNWTRPAQGAPSAAAQLPVRTMACAATSRQEVSHASATRPWSSCHSHPPAECSGPQALINRGDDKRLRCARGRRGAGSSSCSAAVKHQPRLRLGECSKRAQQPRAERWQHRARVRDVAVVTMSSSSTRSRAAPSSRGEATGRSAMLSNNGTCEAMRVP